MKLVSKIYRWTSGFSPAEKYGLVSQIRRSAVSIPSNIAEGAARNTNKEFAKFLYIERGSLAELQTQIQIAEELNYGIATSGMEKSCTRIHSLLNGLIRKLNS